MMKPNTMMTSLCGWTLTLALGGCDEPNERAEELALAQQAEDEAELADEDEAAGPRETIDHGRSGFLWNHLDELLAGTRALIADETLRKGMSNQAMAASERFTHGQFLARVDAIIDQLTSGRREVPVCAS